MANLSQEEKNVLTVLVNLLRSKNVTLSLNGEDSAVAAGMIDKAIGIISNAKEPVVEQVAQTPSS